MGIHSTMHDLIIIFARGPRVQYARTLKGDSFTTKRNEAYRFTPQAGHTLLARLNSGGLRNCYTAFAHV